MLNTVKTKAVSTKNFVSKHRVAIAVTLTSACWLKILSAANEEHNEFLKEHGLFDAFYTPSDEELI